jgi:hypothetical protein
MVLIHKFGHLILRINLILLCVHDLQKRMSDVHAVSGLVLAMYITRGSLYR